MSARTDHPLFTATRRLVSALESLELNLQSVAVGAQRDVQQHQHIQHYERENAQLRAQAEELTVSYSELQLQYEELQGVAGTIYGKLDDSIKRLTQILDSEK